MSREIKFRALYDDMNMEWRYGMLIYEGVVPRIQQKGTMLFSTCLKGTEGQFTGLFDKNGKEIYFGDILATINNNTDFDIWHREDHGYTVCIEKKDKLGVSFTKWHPEPIGEDSVYSLSFCEVIGNIFENKELLK